MLAEKEFVTIYSLYTSFFNPSFFKLEQYYFCIYLG